MQMNAILRSGAPGSQERAYSFLKSAILDFDFKPNERLRAQEIATQLELSRTPVREALSRLEQEGFVVRAGGWGYVVKPITLKEALDVYSVRAALEVEAVKEAIPRLRDDYIVHLRMYLQKAEEKLQQKRLKEYRDNTRAFYRSIAKLTDNACLDHMLSLIDDRIRWLGAMITAQHYERPQESLKGNRKILEALEARDEVAAEAAVRAHVAGAKDSYMRHVTMERGVFFGLS
jgi:DNA-binding GntR family transcriptional regulator